jgi:hypothetical protein
MGLLKAISEFPVRRLSRLPLPNNVALLDACKHFHPEPKNVEETNSRISRILSVFNSGKAASVGGHDVRFIVAAIGSSALIGREEVRGVLAEIESRKDGRLVRSAFKALLANYRDRDLRSLLRTFVSRYASGLSIATQRFCERSGILKGDPELEALSERLVESPDIYASCVSVGLTSSILATGYGTEIKLGAIRSRLTSSDAEALQSLLNWSFSGINGIPLSDYYEAILEPFEATAPSPDVQKLLVSTLVSKFRDPRIYPWPRLTGADSAWRREKCVETIKRWLSIEYLDLFIQIIEATAVDSQFNPRKHFWLRYFEQGVISDLTLVLAADADSVARKARGRQAGAEYMKWATLNLADTKQSVLLMRLGDLVIAEWSHNGAMRFWKASDKAAPEFHLSEYSARLLRNGGLKIKVGNEYRSAIVHQQNGQWMRWARDTIEFHTGIRV